MIYLTVTEDQNGVGIQQLPVEDILYMQFDNRLLISVQTEAAQYFTVGNLRFWEAAFEKAGLNFLRLDRGVLANLDKIKMVDSTYKLAYFGSTITNSKHCTMSTSGYKAIHERMPIAVPQITLPFT
jgi:DNA-binding LytR/AlgR family response regulator